ncbi:unnamed protein product [Sphagnum balticum]
MGKNQAYKAMQRSKMSSSTAAGGPGEEIEDGMMDGSFHSPEWHAARLASLQTSHTVTWEEWKQKQKDEAKRQGELEDVEARLMREYRAQLDAERANKLARGSNHADKREKLKKGKKDKERDKEKDKEKSRTSKKRKKSLKKRRVRSDSESDVESSSSDDERRKDRDRRKSKRDKRERKEKLRTRRKHSESTSNSGSDSEGEKKGPLPLSCFFENAEE